VTGNTASGGDAPNGTGAGAFGGGVFAEQAAVTLRTIVIRNNIAQGGAGLNPDSTQFRGGLAEGGGLMTDKSAVVLDHASIIANQALAGNGSAGGYSGAAGGGGAYFNSISGASKSVSIVNSIIADNYAAMGTVGNVAGGGGGGLTFYRVQPTVQFTTIARNRLNSISMQGVAVNGIRENGSFANSIIAEHTSRLAFTRARSSGGSLNLQHARTGSSANIYTGGSGSTISDNNAITA
jgi:hypothetical protein